MEIFLTVLEGRIGRGELVQPESPDFLKHLARAIQVAGIDFDDQKLLASKITQVRLDELAQIDDDVRRCMVIPATLEELLELIKQEFRSTLKCSRGF